MLADLSAEAQSAVTEAQWRVLFDTVNTCIACRSIEHNRNPDRTQTESGAHSDRTAHR